MYNGDQPTTKEGIHLVVNYLLPGGKFLKISMPVGKGLLKEKKIFHRLGVGSVLIQQ
jgi:hypothetical protein